MLDVAYIGLTVVFFIVVTLIGVGVDRLGRRDRGEAGITTAEFDVRAGGNTPGGRS